MKWEDLEPDLQSLAKDFYLYQKILRSTPLGTINPIDNKPLYPVYHKECYKLFISAEKSIKALNGELLENQFPENNKLSPFGFLDDFSKQEALLYYIKLNGQIIEPPASLSNMVLYYINMLKIPWK